MLITFILCMANVMHSNEIRQLLRRVPNAALWTNRHCLALGDISHQCPNKNLGYQKTDRGTEVT